MPTVSLTNFSNTQYQLTIDGNTYLLKKVNSKTAVSGNYILLFYQEVETNAFRQQWKLLYSDFTDPTAANAIDLKAKIDFIIDSYANYTDLVLVEVKNTSGSPISKGTPVYITGTVGATDVLTIAPADAANSAKMPATGLVYSTLANNEFGHVIVTGLLTQITTNPIDGLTPTVNQTVYVKPGGGLTLTKPTGTNLIQNVGKVGRVSGGGSGSIAVANIQRSNDIPNLAQNNLWIGNASGVPTAATLSGDVTNSAGVVTIANDAVTFAKMQNISTDRLLGRDTAGTGDVEELTVGGGIEFTGTGIQTSAFTGDVTKTAGGTTTTIANDAVTFAKFQNINTDRLLGRDTAGSGDMEELTVGGGVEFTGTGIQTSAFTGDVTKSAGGTATTIANDAVTYAKMQNVSAASRLLGRGDSGAGDVQEIILGSGLTMTGTTLSASGGGGGGITTLNTLTAATQTFATGTTGTDFNISSATSTHTFNIPSASATARGLITNGVQTIGGAKTFDSRLTVSAGGLSVTSTTSQNNIIATSGNTLIEATPGSTTSNVLILRNNNASTTNATFCLALDSVNTATSMDIRLGSTNPKGIRMYASDSQLLAAPTGAAFQMFTNAQPTFPGQLYFDSGANNSAAIIYRTSTTGNNATERLRIFSDGNIGIAVAGTNGGFKFDVNGTTRLQGDVTISDTRNFILATGTGTKIGTATTQKLAFWNAAPIVQPTTAVAAATRVGGGGTTVTDTDTFDGYTIAQVVKALRNIGLLA